ncbi:MAG TPA: YwmB family TATA-box binding protein [Negativicutes bacterium]|nr:YwmB family TATA-box binding protein [Negativicutes bacterium]
MRRSFCYALMAGLLFLSLLFYGRINDAAKATRLELMAEAMAATGATTERVIYNAWTRLPDAGLSDDGLKAVATAALAKLGYYPGQFELLHSRSERHRLVKVELADGERHIVVMVQVVYPVWKETSAEAYLVINAETLTETPNSAQLRDRVAAAANSAGGSPRITTCLVGGLDGKLEKDKWSELLHKAGQVLGAADVAVVVQPNYASLTGYSAAMPESLTVGDKLINVNLAVRYSPHDNRTYVVIASPVITGEY